MLMAAHIVLGLLSLGGGDSGAFSTQLCTGQRGSCKNLGYLLGFIAGTLSGRDQGVKGLLTSSGEGICSSVCAVSFSVSSGISLGLLFMLCGRNAKRVSYLLEPLTLCSWPMFLSL